nr:MAG TPA: hypothetical protein [Caudoviricetes sp.]
MPSTKARTRSTNPSLKKNCNRHSLRRARARAWT